MNLRHLLLAALMLTALLPPASAVVSSVEITPSSPVQGDTLIINLVAAPNESVPITVTFTKSLPVIGGKYDLPLHGVNIPQTPNNFIVRAEGVQNLTVAVVFGIWVSQTGTASGGVATVSRGGVFPGSYEARIHGTAAPGATSVLLKITASTTVTVGADGRYTYSYNTGPIPAGDFTANVGGVTRSMTLAPPGGGGGGGGLYKPVPVATFKSSVYTGEEVSFDGSASSVVGGKIVSWSWGFGDGYTAEGSTVKHTYAAKGRYMVSLRVVDDMGGFKVGNWTIVVENVAPKAEAGSAHRAFAGSRVDFSAAGSSDADGEIVGYAWSFGDGSSGGGESVDHVYAEPGVFEASLTVTDDDGATGVAVVVITVVAHPVTPESLVEETVEAGRNRVVNASEGIPMRAWVNASAPVTVGFASYPSNPHPEEGEPPNHAGGWYDVYVSNPDAVEWPLYVEFSYSQADVAGRDESTLGLYYFDGSAWRRCVETGVRPEEGVVWARFTRLELCGSPVALGAATATHDIRVTSLVTSAARVKRGATLQVNAVYTNAGLAAGEETLELIVNGVVVDSRVISLEAGATSSTIFDIVTSADGVLSLELGGLTASVEVYTPRPASLSVTGLSVAPRIVRIGGGVEVNATITNAGEETGSGSYEVKLDGLTAATQSVELPGGESTTLRLRLTAGSFGVHSVTVGGVEATFTVSEAADSAGVGFQWAGIAVVIVVIAVSLFLIWRSRHPGETVAASQPF
jgi:PKD repeat protein